MIVRILGEVFEFNKDTDTIDHIIHMIVGYLEKRQLLLSHLKVDGVDIDEGFDEYLRSNVNSIETIEVFTKTLKDVLDEMIITANDYLQRAIPGIDAIINQFYQAPTKETWLELNNLFEGLQWILQLTQTIHENPSIYEGWDSSLFNMQKFTEILTNLEEGMVNTDPILIADVLSYEVAPILNSFKSVIAKIVETEVIPHVRN